MADLPAALPENDEEALRVLRSLRERGAEDPGAWPRLLTLVASAQHQRPHALSPGVGAEVLAAAEGCLEAGLEVRSWDWKEPFLHLPVEALPRGLALLARGALGVLPRGFRDAEASLSALLELAPLHGPAVIKALGPYLTDAGRRRERGAVRPLLERIGLPAVRSWLGGLGPEQRLTAARAIAFHLESPSTGGPGAEVPPLTEWLLTEFADDETLFRSFLDGRHGVGYPCEGGRIAPAEAQDAYAPYLAHPLRRIREWAEYECGRP